MASETPAQRLKRFSKLVPDESAIRGLIQDLEKDKTGLADYAIALICQTFVEKALEIAIFASLAPYDEEANKRIFDYDNRGPIADFSAKIKLGYVMGIFGKETKADLDLIREIRNAFAHSLQPISFETKEVIDMCGRLAIQPMAQIRVAGFPPTARQRYISATTILAGRLKIAIERSPAVDLTLHIKRFRRGLD
jgi:hypothetical protein